MNRASCEGDRAGDGISVLGMTYTFLMLTTLSALAIAHAIHGGMVVQPPFDCFVYIQAPEVGARLPCTIRGTTSYEYPCCGPVMSPADSAEPTSPIHCDSPMDPSCATCPCESYVQHFWVAAGDSLVIPGARSVRVEGWGWAVQIPSGGNADLDLNGDVGTDADLAYFFQAMATGGAVADFDDNGDSGTDADMAAMYAALAGR